MPDCLKVVIQLLLDFSGQSSETWLHYYVEADLNLCKKGSYVDLCDFIRRQAIQFVKLV